MPTPQLLHLFKKELIEARLIHLEQKQAGFRRFTPSNRVFREIYAHTVLMSVLDGFRNKIFTCLHGLAWD